jgi:hypothetical protein
MIKEVICCELDLVFPEIIILVLDLYELLLHLKKMRKSISKNSIDLVDKWSAWKTKSKGTNIYPRITGSSEENQK